MKNNSILPVVMAGGSGTRLWPLSRALYPKQFLALGLGGATLFQQATQRLAALAGGGAHVSAPCVVTNEEHRFMVLDQLREIGVAPGAVILEPAGRNTAPALTMAALYASGDDGSEDPILVVTPSDQTVTLPEAFDESLRSAVAAAAGGNIVILGVSPTRPETGFGYIRAAAQGSGAMEVQSFVEKPDVATAQRYLDEGGYYWNSGMFVLRASTWLRALQACSPDIGQASAAAWKGRGADAAFLRPDKALFAAIRGDSIDYAVMEKAAGAGFQVRMVPLDAGWSDLGAWEAVWQVSPQDGQGNALHGDVMAHDSRDTLVHATGRLVGVVGLDSLVVVETPDAVLVVHKSRTQDVKHLVRTLEQAGRPEGLLHRRVYRPWGWYDGLDSGPGFQVKRIMVKPGAALSLQMHKLRAEHWVVVSGTAEVTNGQEAIRLNANESTYIPAGRKHRLANVGDVPLEVIEVQSGSYLGEDDIVRFDDAYGRK
jgi:mannose-1-phosphate guanylyltransferase/mannose-6-phosphate isomerase